MGFMAEEVYDKQTLDGQNVAEQYLGLLKKGVSRGTMELQKMVKGRRRKARVCV